NSQITRRWKASVYRTATARTGKGAVEAVWCNRLCLRWPLLGNILLRAGSSYLAACPTLYALRAVGVGRPIPLRSSHAAHKRSPQGAPVGSQAEFRCSACTTAGQRRLLTCGAGRNLQEP